jgi:putative ABC transport system permease protein
VLLTATGLFALVSLTVVKKMKEIAVRKVVGARPGHILLLVNRGYFWIFIIAAALGCYGGYALTGMLLNMIFGVNAGIAGSTLVNSVIVLFIIVAVTSGMIISIAVITVLYQSIRAAVANPVKSLRTE